MGAVCVAYLDDVITFSDGDLDDHWSKFKQVLALLEKGGLRLDPRKCEFASKEIKYLGFIIDVQKGIPVDPEKIKAISLWEAPKNVKETRSFLGFANFYRNFISDFAKISGPLNDLTKKYTPFAWEKEHQLAFEKLKILFTTAPILKLWHEDCKTVLETKASGWATGGCLSQYDAKGCLRPVAYFSINLSPVECNYSIHDKELMSIVRCLNEWRGELMGLESPFLILTEHKNLNYFMTTQKLTERHVRWSQPLSQFNFTLFFRAGKKGARPDALSHRGQDMPESPNDPRLKKREFQLIQADWLQSPTPKQTNTLASI